MRSRTRVGIALTTVSALACFWLTGCQPASEITGTITPNAAPITELTGFPPSLYETTFAVDFRWTGYDRDGRIAGFRWKLSNNWADGISIEDTLTVDPVTGSTINPWHFTTATDTTFFVTADIPNYPNDDEDYQRSYQPHTLFIAAVDNECAIDESPANVSFTATTLLPRIRVSIPAALVGQNEAGGLPTNVTLQWSGEDHDAETGTPTSVRYLWKEAWLPDEGYVSSAFVYNQHVDELIDFADSLWSPWQPYGAYAAQRRVTFPDQPADLDKRYLFAIQARDTAGAVSIDREYGYSVVNVKIVQNRSPRLDIYEQNLGSWDTYFDRSSFQFDIAAGQELSFSWSADAEDYAGTIESYRWGWDVTDPNDDNDPNWSVLPGLSPMHVRTGPQVFQRDVHTLTIQAIDDSGLLVRCKVIFNVVPIPPAEEQDPVLLVDDVEDHNSNRWPDRWGSPQDTDERRDAFWEAVLDAVPGYHSGLHSIDTYQSRLKYRDLVGYRVVVWTSKWVMAPYNLIADEFRPTSYCYDNRLIWLEAYQELVGNVLFASSRGLNQFLRQRNNYMTPVIIDSYEETYTDQNGDNFIVGFGTCIRPDGEAYRVGLETYPYKTMGVSMIDWVSPKYRIYGRRFTGEHERKTQCVGAKGLIIDPDFLTNNIPGGGAFADTISTNSLIDWKDDTIDNDRPYYDNLSNPWNHGDTEFYDEDIAGRPTDSRPQICDGDYCVEPMFRIYSRFDWIKQQHILAGDPDWPEGEHSQDDLDDFCGEMALQNDLETFTNGLTCGFITHKLAPYKPSRRGDVVWGFDPYRFDPQEIGRAIHWVLGEHFGLIVE